MKAVPLTSLCMCLAHVGYAVQLQLEPQHVGNAQVNDSVINETDKPLFDWVRGILHGKNSSSEQSLHSATEALTATAALAKDASVKSTAKFREWAKKARARVAASGTSRSSGAQAVGDPHMTNVRGQRFDLAHPGEHTLIVIPRFAGLDEGTLLRVRAEVRRSGLTCEDIYIKTLNVTGSWVEATRTDRVSFHADIKSKFSGKWLYFGKVQLKVVNGITKGGVTYLNFFVRNLGHTGLAVGGLLGEDDHTAAATPLKGCGRTIALLADSSAEDRLDSARSSAQASLLQES